MSENFVTLALEQRLVELSPSEAKFSRGFLAADLSSFLGDLADHWRPFFHSAEVEVKFIASRKSLNYPQELTRIVVVEIGGESAVLGIDEFSLDYLSSALVPKIGVSSAECLVEYLERRFLTTLTKSWKGAEPLSCFYLSSDWAEEVEVIGSVEVELVVAGEKVMFWVGIGPRMVEEIDRLWRKAFVEKSSRDNRERFDDRVHDISIELACLHVPPAMLIDYMRSGTVIDLEIPVSDQAYILVDGEPFATGTLKQLNGSFAVEILELDEEERGPVEGTTRVSIQIADLQMDSALLSEYRQPGAVLASSTSVRGNVSLVINGEYVASGILGEMNGNLAVSVLPK